MVDDPVHRWCTLVVVERRANRHRAPGRAGSLPDPRYRCAVCASWRWRYEPENTPRTSCAVCGHPQPPRPVTPAPKERRKAARSQRSNDHRSGLPAPDAPSTGDGQTSPSPTGAGRAPGAKEDAPVPDRALGHLPATTSVHHRWTPLSDLRSPQGRRSAETQGAPSSSTPDNIAPSRPREPWGACGAPALSHLELDELVRAPGRVRGSAPHTPPHPECGALRFSVRREGPPLRVVMPRG